MMDDALLLPRAELYAERNRIELIRQPILGHGSDGTVWRTTRPSALKILEQEKNFRCELECYRRLKRAKVQTIGQFAVPLLEGYDEQLRAIEMSCVDPPYLLDFGKVHLDSAPPYFNDRQMRVNAYAEWRERFGKDWQAVARAMRFLENKLGIYYVDPRPANICTGRNDDEDDEAVTEDPIDEPEPPEDQ